MESGQTASLSTARKSTTTQEFPLGTFLRFQDGRTFQYGSAGASVALAPGKLYQSEVPGANFDDIVVPATAIGARVLTVTTQATLISADLFNGGYVVVQDDTGEGYAYLIDDTAAVAATTLGTGAIVLAEGIVVALIAATTVLLTKNPLANVIVHPSPATAAVVGVATGVVAASSFSWLQTRGLCPVLTDTTVVIGKSVIASSLVDGAVTPMVLTEGTPNTEIQPIVGIVHEVAIDTEYSAIKLAIPGSA